MGKLFKKMTIQYSCTKDFPGLPKVATQATDCTTILGDCGYQNVGLGGNNVYPNDFLASKGLFYSLIPVLTSTFLVITLAVLMTWL